MQCVGDRDPGQPWRIGIADPLRPGRLAAIVRGRDFAVATSGIAERGPHIIDPHACLLATGLASITVVGPRLTLADSYATAAFAMAARARDWMKVLDGDEAFAVAGTAAPGRAPVSPAT